MGTTLHEHIDGCRALSDNDIKNLMWQNKETKIDIGVKYDKPFFELAFSEEKPRDSVNTVYCGVSNEKVKFRSWVATKYALEQPVHVEISTIDVERTFSDFIIMVGDNWRALDATKEECKLVNKSLGERISGRIFCRRSSK